MDDWLAGGHFVDALIAFTLIEAALLLVYRRRTGKGVAAGDFLANLVSGLCLMLALRAALAGAAWIWILLAVTAAGLAHGIDLWRRWQH